MIEITPHVTSLHVDLAWFPQPYPPNVFLIRDGGEAALVDAGFNDDESYNKRIAMLAEAGSAKLKYIFITHHHYDHAAGAHRLREATGAQIVMHRDEEPLLLSTESETGDMEIPEDQKEAREQAKKWREEAARAVPDVRVADGYHAALVDGFFNGVGRFGADLEYAERDGREDGDQGEDDGEGKEGTAPSKLLDQRLALPSRKVCEFLRY